MHVALRIPVAVAALAGAHAAAEAAALPPLLPMPAVVQEQAGSFALANASLGGHSPAAARFAELWRRGGGRALPARGTGTIRFVRDASIVGEEAYRLDVAPRGVTVAASSDAGLFYGAETLWQLAASAKDGRIAAVHIEDRPAFAWRGLMLDSVRHFQPVDYILATLDRMAEAKLNTFHWHLADDQGWRLQIDRYPRLTSVGAWRTEAGSGQRYGGFYTKDDVRRIVAYAAARHIVVVPEIEMPGHATAMIAAYPELGSSPRPPKAPTGDWGILPNLLNTDDATFTFLDNVLDEVMALFPSKVIHTGGDEAPKDQWKADPRAQARLHALGLKDENALQGWFTARLAEYLGRHGRRLVGWDEILEGKVPGDAIVMSWRGMDGAITAAKQGHDTVLAPAPMLYLDYRQSDAADETPGRGEIVDWQRLYAFDMQPAALTPDERRHILGIQATLFTEHARSVEMMDRMIWPRAVEAAELGWSPAAGRSWTAFAPRLLATLNRWDRLGWRYDTVPLAPAARIEGQAVALRQPAGIGTLRYTTGGTAPTPASPAYTAPVPLADAARLAARSFLGAAPAGAVRDWRFTPASLRTRVAADMALCSNKLPIRAEDFATHVIHWVDVMQPCWRWPNAMLDGAATVTAEIGTIPFNYALGADFTGLELAKASTPGGELEVRQDGCAGTRIAVLPIAAGATRVSSRITPTAGGLHELCMTFTQGGSAPLRVLDRLTLEAAR